MTLNEHNDQPRQEIMALAEETIKKHIAKGMKAEVYFKFTCPNCGERCTFRDPNMLWEEGECCACGQTHPVERAGFSLVVTY